MQTYCFTNTLTNYLKLIFYLIFFYLYKHILHKTQSKINLQKFYISVFHESISSSKLHTLPAETDVNNIVKICQKFSEQFINILNLLVIYIYNMKK